MVTNSIAKRPQRAKKPATSATTGELAAVGSLGANVIVNPRRKPNYRAPHASGGTIGDVAIVSDAPDTDRDPPTSRTIEREEEPPPPRSAILMRVTDGSVFVTLEDAPAEINLDGREVVRAVRIEAHELDDSRERIVDALDDVAGNLIGLLARST